MFLCSLEIHVVEPPHNDSSCLKRWKSGSKSWVWIQCFSCSSTEYLYLFNETWVSTYLGTWQELQFQPVLSIISLSWYQLLEPTFSTAGPHLGSIWWWDAWARGAFLSSCPDFDWYVWYVSKLDLQIFSISQDVSSSTLNMYGKTSKKVLWKSLKALAKSYGVMSRGTCVTANAGVTWTLMTLRKYWSKSRQT